MGWLGSRRVRVPENLAEVTACDAAEAPSREAGLDPEAVAEVWRAVEKLYRSGAYPGVAFCLRRRGAVILNRALGHARGNGPGDRDPAARRPLAVSDPVCLFSASKAVTAVLIHKLAEEGGLDLDAPVARYLPEFAANGKAGITVSAVLSHRGGIAAFPVPPGESPVDTLLDWDRSLELICAAPPSREGALAYHAITGGFVLGEIIRRVTGGDLVDYLDRRLRRPLGMRHFTFGLPPRGRDDAVLNYSAGQPVRFPLNLAVERALAAPFDDVVDVSNSRDFMQAVIPAGNLYATAEELSRFYQMLLEGGRYRDRTVLSPATVARLRRPASRPGFDRTLKIPMRYSEGLMLGADPFGLYGPMSGRAYGHIGFMNILGWADPDRDLAASLLVTGKAVLGGHLLPLVELLIAIARTCRR